MPLPTLRPMQITQPQPVNAMLAGQQVARQREEHNWLRAQEGREVKSAKETSELRRIQQTALATSTALKADDPKLAQQIFNRMAHEKDKGAEFVFEGGKQTITLKDGTKISGSQLDVQNFFEGLQDMSNFTEPQKARHTAAWLKAAVARGLTVDFKQQPTGKTAKERTWMRETGGKISMSQWELQKKLVEDEAREELSDKKQARLDKYERGYNDARDEVVKIESELTYLDPEDKSDVPIIRARRNLLKRFQRKARMYQRKMNEITGEEEKKKVLDDATARRFFEEAKGDIHKAAELAREEGYEVPPFSGDYGIK